MKQLLRLILLLTSLFHIAASFAASLSQRQRSVQEVMNVHSPLRKEIKSPFKSTALSSDLKHNGNSPVHRSNHKGPIYITVGPQCSGKTTFLSNKASEVPIIDISIDDQKGVYLKIPTKLFLHDSPHDLAKHNTQSSHNDLLNTSIHNKTIADRICDESNDEMRLVVQRLCQKITADEFREKAMQMDESNSIQGSWQRLPTEEKQDTISSCQSCDNSNDWKLVLIQIVEEQILSLKPNSSSVSSSSSSRELSMSQHCELFIVESIFKSPSTSSIPSILEMDGLDLGTEDAFEWPHHITSRKMSGLNAAISKLKHVANAKKDTNLAMTPVAWGNTNSKARDYASALEAAEYSKRPVHFVPYADLEYLNTISTRDEEEVSVLSSSSSSSTLFLPRVGIRTLLYRNLKRLVETGKYIPTKAIIDTTIRVSQLVQKASVEMTKQVPNSDLATQFDMDKVLVKMVGYEMRRDRTVYKISQSSSFRQEGSGRGRGRGKGRNIGSSSGRGASGRGGGRGNQTRRPSASVSGDSIGGGGSGRGRNNGSGRSNGSDSSNGSGRSNGRGRGHGRPGPGNNK